jgi:alpha-amylase
MATTINLMFGIHSHQPVGNFEGVFRKAYEDCYRPFLETLERHPGVRVALHYSGPLLEWLEQSEPRYIDLIASVAGRGQVEMLSGGFYEPILPVIPRDDAIGQIQMMNDYIRRRFGQQARGLWLTERVWEPHLPSILADAGIRYTIIDETHFVYAGLGADDMFGYYLTEDNAATVAVFPIDKNLRYQIPFKLPEDTLAYLRSVSADGRPRDITYGDDGEKFGMWPETHKWVYTEGYLERFFTMLEQNADWIAMPTFSEFIESHPPAGRVYLPTASYDEMMEWALPAGPTVKYQDIIERLKSQGLYQEYRAFVRGGFWRNFLAKYPEANRLHKKMLRVSRTVGSLEGKTSRKVADEARRELWRGQCNCPYWHGLFGGLYLNYLRFANYSHLLRAERLAEQALHAGAKIHHERADYDCDGHDEILVSTPEYSVAVSPGYGGSVAEIGYRPTCFNISDVMSRRPESYHRKLQQAADHDSGGVKSIHDIVRVKEAGLERALHYDAYDRRCFLDHFLPAGTTVDDFASARHCEEGDFLGVPYDVADVRKSHAKVVVKLERAGSLNRSRRVLPIRLEKELTIGDEKGVASRYTIRSEAESIDAVLFAVELNLTLLAGDNEDRYYEIPGVALERNRMNSLGAVDSVGLVRLVDRWMKIAIVLRFEPTATFWRFPIETVSQSEGGFERTYQGSSVTAVWPLGLAAGAEAEFSIGVNVEPL